MSVTRYLTPPQYAAMLRCKPETVRGFIERGELAAVNLGTKSRPRYRISPSAIIEFEHRRSGKRAKKPCKRKKAKRPDFVEFY